jgi:hypothetical protein
LAVLVGIAVLRIVIGTVPVPLGWVKPASLGVTVLFVVAPILALYAASAYCWTYGRAAIFLAIGAAVWWGAYVAASKAGGPFLGGVLLAISQSGLIAWCFAIGAMLALAIKDRNMLVPIAIFLALFDMWLVFAPEGLVQQTVVRGSGKTLAMLGYQVPQVATVSAGGRAAPLLFVGPADYLFLTMFFVALYRFRMRIGATLRAIAPVLALYLLVVLWFSDVQLGPIRLGALPALVPIGLVVLWVNRSQFALNKDEKLTTWFIAVVGAIVVMWRISQPPPPPQVVTLPSEPGQESQGSPGSPGQDGRGRSRLPRPTVPGSNWRPL